jgi:hypothetical protein
MLKKEKTILESLMAHPISSLRKPLSLTLGIALLFPFFTSCAREILSEGSTPSIPGADLVTQTVTVMPAAPVEESIITPMLSPSVLNGGKGTPCLPVGEPYPLPDVPFNDMPQAVLDFINGGGTVEALSEALYLAGIANMPEPIATGDMDGDGLEEVVVSIFEPDSMGLPPAGMLLIFTCKEGAYQLAYKEDTRPSEGAPGIRFLQDLNASGNADLVISSASCGAHTCFERVQVIQWDGTEYRNHLEGDTSDLPYPTIYLSPTERDGVYDLQVTGSGFGSVGAGPQRNVSWTWFYNEEVRLWQVSGFQREPSSYRIHVLHDAAQAAKNGEYQQALILYNRVISDSTLEDWVEPELEQAWIQAFARYQMVVIYTLQDREPFANTVLEELKSTTSPDNPQYGYFEMAVAYLDGFQEGGAEMGCKLAQDYVVLHPELSDTLGPQLFGYGNQTFTEKDVCP